MANYYASSRTSYAKMKDDDAFREWADSVPNAEVIWQDTVEDGRLYGFLFGTFLDNGGIPGSRYDEDSREGVDFDIYEEIQAHLADGWAISFVEIGSEKMRYLNGFACVVSNKDIKYVNLTDWADKTTRDLGLQGTRAEY